VNRHVAALAVACLSLTAVAAQTHPHFRTTRPMPVETTAGRPPFETPPSLACVYGLVSNIVAGCPVIGTSALPSGGSGIIAVVNAFDYPPAAGDLNVFSRRFGLPECNAAHPCFKKVFATGAPPPVDSLWAANAAEIIEYAHAFAPEATVVLIETLDASQPQLMKGVRLANAIIAASPGGHGQVILPFGSPEFPTETEADANLTAPGVVYLSGSEGAQDFLDWPPTSPNVLTVGGTSLIRDSQGLFVEEIAASAWTGDISMFEPRPPYQDAIESIVQNGRGIPDVAFAADIVHGAGLLYDSVPFGSVVGWQFTGNVGFGEAVWAAIINQAGHNSASTADELALLYSELGDPTSLRDITRGQGLGVPAKAGWDFVTGLGVPVGFSGK
jgi:hypothetical protein